MPNVIILTGAGISAESGIATFRDANGVWETYRIEDVASPLAFQRHPNLVHRFYNLRREQLKSVVPNAAHYALAAFERAWEGRGRFLLITQNVDDLHERAGSKKLIHMHGEIRKLRCGFCADVKYHEDDAGTDLVCAVCNTANKMRPDIVWFGEIPYGMAKIYEAIESADVFISIGTSGAVYPAAGFADAARQNGRNCEIIEINPNPTASMSFNRRLAETAIIGVPKIVEYYVGVSTQK